MKKDMIKVYALIIIGIVIISVVGMTFAFFSLGVVNEGASGVTYELTDEATLTFEKGDELTINASLDNFSMSGSNLSSTTTAKVTLDATENYTADYYVYFQINSNDFAYTTEDETAELVLKITGPNGEVKSIDGLDYVTSGGVSGFDITTLNEYLIEIATPEWLTLNYSASNTSISNEWTFTLYFINLDTNQNENSGKTFDSEIVMSGTVYSMPPRLFEQILLDVTEEVSVETAKSVVESKDIPSFEVSAETEEGMYATEDDFGISYYFRGVQEKNYVLFADMLWRIVRIDGEDNVKLILFNESSEGTSYLGINNGATIAWNSTTNNSIYAGYMYTSSELHGNDSPSNMKIELDTWYEAILKDTDYEKYISTSAIFCNDRTFYTNTSGTLATAPISSGNRYFGGYLRLLTNKTPTLMCPDVLDAFTVDETEVGNGALTNPVGLITADEISFAGAGYNMANSVYFLKTGNYHWSGTPYYFSSSTVNLFRVSSDSSMLGHTVSYAAAVYATLSLSFYARYESGDGSLENPYTIKI